MNRNWKQMTASLLVLASLTGQSAFAVGKNGGGSSHHNGGNSQPQGKVGMTARPSFHVQPQVASGNGGTSFKSLPGKVSVQPGTLKPTSPFKQPVKVLPVGGFPVKPLPVGPIGPVKPPKVGNPFPPIGPIGPVKPPKVNPLPPIGPIGPIGPVKPPVVNPLPPIGPIGPVGPIKPPMGPFPPIGPVNPLPPIGPLPPSPPINPNPPMPPSNPHHHHCHPHWGCWTGWCGGWINCPIVQPCSLPLVSVVEVIPVQTTVVLPVRREIDLAVKEVRVVEKGDAVNGPLYRVFITNKSLNDLDVPARVALLGVNGDKPTDDTPRAIELLKSLRSGETAAMDIRLPATAAAYPLLLVVAEVPENYVDTNEQDNVAQGEVARLPLLTASTN